MKLLVPPAILAVVGCSVWLDSIAAPATGCSGHTVGWSAVADCNGV